MDDEKLVVSGPDPTKVNPNVGYWDVMRGDYYFACQCAWKDAQDIAEAVNSYAAIKAENKRLHEALESIRVYGSDTLSGRMDGPDDREWQRGSVIEMTKRARVALVAAEAIEEK